MVPIFMYASTVERDPTSTSCNILWPESEHISGQAAFTLYSFILGFAIPLLLIFVFYFLVIRKLKTVGPKNKSKEKKKSHRKVTKLVLTVIAVYILCWLPYWITQVRYCHVITDCLLNCGLCDRLCGLVVRVPGYTFRGPGFDFRCYRIF
jgi:heme/copper-type cytochrome/quinol oxidase subunit 2